MSVLLPLTLSLAHSLSGPALAVEAQPTRRFAFVIGSNDGGEGRVVLRYANSDADIVSQVLEELGGVHPEDRLVALDASSDDLHAGFDEMRRRVEAAEEAGERTELLVYYSGHSDEEGLLPTGELYDYRTLRGELDAIPADVRLLVLDSCASGAMVRQKGGTMRAPFLVDESVAVSGHAYLTSSSADEAAQESDKIGGSFFTHFFVSGLRGAADTSLDGRVTLNEAYHFAYTETLARTERTSAGPQHAAYDIQLNGTGDLVMTDLSQVSAGLSLGQAVTGRIYVRDDQGRLIAELNKAGDRELLLGLAPGTYTVLVDDGVSLREATVTLGGAVVDLADADFVSVDAVATVARGGEVDAYTWIDVPFATQLLPDFAMNKDARSERELHHFTLGLLGARVDRLDGFAGSLGLTVSDMDARGGMFTVGANIAAANMDGGMGSAGVNIVGGDMDGGMGSAGVNIVGGSLEGGQGSAGANLVGGSARGVQGASGFNLVGVDLRGAQGTAGANIVGGDVAGFQGAACVNVAGGDMRGAQLAAGANLAAGSMRGVQGAAGFNVAGPESRGLQGAAGVNVARDLEGAQLATVNVAKKVDGTQIGLVNVAGTAGSQLGLVNVSDDVGFALGLVTISRSGVHDLEVYASEESPANLSLKLGSKRFYTALTGGWRPMDYALSSVTADGEVVEQVTSEHRFTTGAGFGVRFNPEGRLTADLDALAVSYLTTFDYNTTLTAQLRATAGFNLTGHFGVIGGLSANALVWDWTGNPAIAPFPFDGESILRGTPWAVDPADQGDKLAWWPGVTIGIRVN